MRREPLGVCAAMVLGITPYRSRSGNQLRRWPAEIPWCSNLEVTPLTALKLAEIYTEAGLPAGVFNVALGMGETGAALVQHPDVAKVSLTGSVPTGKRCCHGRRVIEKGHTRVGRQVTYCGV